MQPTLNIAATTGTHGTPDSNRDTAQTVARMGELIRASIDDPVCQQWADSASRLAMQPAIAVWHLVKARVRFIRGIDERRAAAAGYPEALDFLIQPSVLVRDPNPAGDCDCFTMLVCTLLEILGIRSRIVTIADNPYRWSHVYAGVADTGLPLDASHGPYPGWQVPLEHQHHRAVWDALSGELLLMTMPVDTSNVVSGGLSGVSLAGSLLRT